MNDFFFVSLNNFNTITSTVTLKKKKKIINIGPGAFEFRAFDQTLRNRTGGTGRHYFKVVQHVGTGTSKKKNIFYRNEHNIFSTLLVGMGESKKQDEDNPRFDGIHQFCLE